MWFIFLSKYSKINFRGCTVLWILTQVTTTTTKQFHHPQKILSCYPFEVKHFLISAPDNHWSILCPIVLPFPTSILNLRVYFFTHKNISISIYKHLYYLYNDTYVSSFLLYLKYLYINVYLYMQICHLLYVIMTVHLTWLRNLVYDKCLSYSLYLEKALSLWLMLNFRNSASWTFILLKRVDPPWLSAC